VYLRTPPCSACCTPTGLRNAIFAATDEGARLLGLFPEFPERVRTDLLRLFESVAALAEPQYTGESDRCAGAVQRTISISRSFYRDVKDGDDAAMLVAAILIAIGSRSKRSFTFHEFADRVLAFGLHRCMNALLRRRTTIPVISLVWVTHFAGWPGYKQIRTLELMRQGLLLSRNFANVRIPIKGR
jgi:hypothetical protein